MGDFAKNRETSETFIWDGVWVALFKDRVRVYSINSSSELVTITDANPSDMVHIISEAKTGIYSGTDWVFLLDSGIGAQINDIIINNLNAWSSQKISDELALKQDNLSEGTSIDITDDVISLNTTNGIDMSNADLTNTKLVTFNELFDNGIKTTNWTLLPSNGIYQKVTINEDCFLAISEPDELCTFYLHIHQGELGNKHLNFPPGAWTNGIVKNISTRATAHDLLMIHYYGDDKYIFELMQDVF